MMMNNVSAEKSSPPPEELEGVKKNRKLHDWCASEPQFTKSETPCRIIVRLLGCSQPGQHCLFIQSNFEGDTAGQAL
jgi:hypothetical protein